MTKIKGRLTINKVNEAINPLQWYFETSGRTGKEDHKYELFSNENALGTIGCYDTIEEARCEINMVLNGDNPFKPQ